MIKKNHRLKSTNSKSLRGLREVKAMVIYIRDSCCCPCTYVIRTKCGGWTSGAAAGFRYIDISAMMFFEP